MPLIDPLPPPGHFRLSPELTEALTTLSQKIGVAIQRMAPALARLHEQFVEAGLIDPVTGQIIEDRVAAARARMVRPVSSRPHYGPLPVGLACSPDSHRFDASQADAESAIEEWERFKEEMRSGR